jgi:hypothetical protein
MEYVVADHIYACATESGVVVLDARYGKYSFIPGDRARSVEGVVQGWPALPSVEMVAAERLAPSSLLKSLIEGGMVTRLSDHRSVHGERVVPFPAGEALLDALAATEETEVRWRDVVTFTLSVTYAKLMLKYRPFDALLSDLRRRKNGLPTGVSASPVTQIRESVKTFSWLRPFAYAESDACLFDSVALTDFLLRRGMSVDFFIGVRMRPFVAHSWVQAHRFALNELPEYLSAYTPILSV